MQSKQSTFVVSVRFFAVNITTTYNITLVLIWNEFVYRGKTLVEIEDKKTTS
jgi:hypothetical protein